jgi:hypothetical protein
VLSNIRAAGGSENEQGLERVTKCRETAIGSVADAASHLFAAAIGTNFHRLPS